MDLLDLTQFYPQRNTSVGSFDIIDMTDDEKKLAEQYIQSNGVHGLDNYLSRRLDVWKDQPLDIAVVGSSGVGKSTFINTMRNLMPEDPGAADVGVVETTLQPTPYQHSEYEQLKFWDLPGIGTPNYPKELYLERVQFQKYDFFLIISRTRFTENDLWLASEVKKHNKRFIFIRTNVDADLMNEYNDYPNKYNEEEILERLRNNCLNYVRTVDANADVYLVSGHLRNRLLYDFGRLNETIIRDYPTLKQESMILSMTVSCKEVLLAKIIQLKSRIWLVAGASAAVASIPVPFLSLGFDATIIIKEVEFYRQQLGLDRAALEKLAQVHRLSIEKIEKELSEVFPLQHLTALRKFVLDFCKKEAIGATTEEFARFVPYVGTMIASGISFGVCFLVLTKILARMEQAALKIIDITMEASNMAVQQQLKQFSLD
ncbi:unnamed protein product [Didymodactylos carnosus]|uniref:IRG-type G domain-containing protein n=1 Tax=Didymodactylos carnosus TaxID=1234261 RepID=A0A814GY96_9BILA|nr:unnamed protein product [Didymodactylos carnosus]CAF1191937.1 unnamed protein product [Didymodactylos carnosus]CAF3774431.1 unnamed protein product [Didymodactylos carnosus]CAF4002389.1 unnamed protein product [Didymodactylos carnosus]